MSKRVRITLEVDSTFVKLLQANLQMKAGLLSGEREQDALQVLGVVALGEMRGAIPEQTHARTQIAWRPHIEVVHEERRWKEEGETEWHKTS
jgi:hypothetical protein